MANNYLLMKWSKVINPKIIVLQGPNFLLMSKTLIISKTEKVLHFRVYYKIKICTYVKWNPGVKWWIEIKTNELNVEYSMTYSKYPPPGPPIRNPLSPNPNYKPPNTKPTTSKGIESLPQIQMF